MSLYFDKEYLFGFETLVFATSGSYLCTISLILKEKEKLEIASYDPFNSACSFACFYTSIILKSLTVLLNRIFLQISK